MARMTSLKFVRQLDLAKSDRQPRQVFLRLKPFSRPLRACAPVIRLRLYYPIIKIGLGGRKKSLNAKERRRAVETYQRKNHTVQQICEMMSITKPTLYAYIKENKQRKRRKRNISHECSR
jgi:hypothetical protein